MAWLSGGAKSTTNSVKAFGSLTLLSEQINSLIISKASLFDFS
jgi:hypothetical protein